MAGGGIIVPPGVIRASTAIADQWANNERPRAAVWPSRGSGGDEGLGRGAAWRE